MNPFTQSNDRSITQPKLDGGYDSRQLLCLCQPVTTTRPKSAFWGIFDPNMTFRPQNLMHSSLPPSPLVAKIWPNSVNKYARYLANNVCSRLAHEWMHTSTNTLKT